MKFSKILPVAFMSLGLLVGCSNEKDPTPPVSDAVHTIAINNLTDLEADWLVGGTARTLDLTLTADEVEVNPLTASINNELVFTYSTAGVVSNTGLQLDAVALGTTTLTITYFEVSATVTFSVVETPSEPAIVEGLTCAEITSQGDIAKNTLLYRARGTVKDWATKPGPNQYGEFTLTDGTGDVYFYSSYVNTTEEPASFVWDGEAYDYQYTARNFLTAEMTKDIKVGDEVEIIALHAESYDNFYGIFVSVTPCAEIPATAVTLNKTELTLDAGTSETLTATITPADCNQPVTWTSDNEAVAKVDGTGKVSAIGAGTANVTVTVGTVSATCVVTVNALTTKNVTLTVDSLGLNSQTYAAGTATVNGVAFTYTELGNYGNGIQMRVKDGRTSSFYNTTPLAEPLQSMVITCNSGKTVSDKADAFSIEFANNAEFTDAQVVSFSTVADTYSYTFEPTNADVTYVRFTKTIAQTSFYFDSIALNVE